MSDIVHIQARLRAPLRRYGMNITLVEAERSEAADTIDKLEADNKRLREALEKIYAVNSLAARCQMIARKELDRVLTELKGEGNGTPHP